MGTTGRWFLIRNDRRAPSRIDGAVHEYITKYGIPMPFEQGQAAGAIAGFGRIQEIDEIQAQDYLQRIQRAEYALGHCLVDV